MAHEPREPRLSGSAPTGEDRDLHPAWIIGFGGGIAGLLVVSGIVCGILTGSLRGHLRKTYPGPSPIPEARLPVEYPEPRLQVTPRLDMRDYREREELLLRSYGWSDREAEIAHVPIERAIDLYLSGRVAPAMEAPPGSETGMDAGAPPGPAGTGTGMDAGAPPGRAGGGAPDGGRP